jgi:hypothetical protein
MFENLIGKRVSITGSHPWAGESGVVESVQTTAFGKTGMVVNLDSGNSCFVFYGHHIKQLKGE